MDDIGREAGLSKGSLYWHFKSKEEVFVALAQALCLELFQAWEEEAGRHSGSVIELIGRVGELSLERLSAEDPMLRAWAEFIVHREAQEQFAAIYHASRRILGEWIRRGIAAGEICDLDPEGVAAAATAAIEGLLIQTLVDSDFDARRHWRVSWEIFARGIAA
jgi:AcrR family transcriptional regulator